MKFYDVMHEKDDASVRQTVVTSNLTCIIKTAGLEPDDMFFSNTKLNNKLIFIYVFPRKCSDTALYFIMLIADMKIHFIAEAICYRRT